MQGVHRTFGALMCRTARSFVRSAPTRYPSYDCCTPSDPAWACSQLPIISRLVSTGRWPLFLMLCGSGQETASSSALNFVVCSDIDVKFVGRRTGYHSHIFAPRRVTCATFTGACCLLVARGPRPFKTDPSTWKFVTMLPCTAHTAVPQSSSACGCDHSGRMLPTSQLPCDVG